MSYADPKKKRGTILILVLIYAAAAVMFLSGTAKAFRAAKDLIVRKTDRLEQEKRFWEMLETLRKGGDINEMTGLSITDETSLLNINAISAENKDIFTGLLMDCGMDEESAFNFAYQVIDWKDSDAVATVSGRDEHTEYGTGLRKDRPFESVEELGLFKGMNGSLFACLQQYITVVPFYGNLQIDLDSAPRPVMLALFLSVSGSSTNTERSDAESLLQKLFTCREKREGKTGCLADIESMHLNSKERSILLSVFKYKAGPSEYVRIRSGVPAREVIFRRADGKIMMFDQGRQND